MDALQEFGNIAIRLARNPLGIIALLIVLVYAIAGLVATSDSFQPAERGILVWFLVLFPAMVGIVLLYLVTQHHTKLYAPSDFSNPEHFLDVLDARIERSPKVQELESIMHEVQNRIDNQPLYRYTKLSEEGKLVCLFAEKGELVEFVKMAQERDELDVDEMNRQVKILEEYGWIEVRDEKAFITEKGSREIESFSDLAYGRLG